MAGVSKIHKLKANQRKHFKSLLFYTNDPIPFSQKRILVVDDSAFTGSTAKGLAHIALQENACNVDILTVFWCSSLQKR